MSFTFDSSDRYNTLHSLPIYNAILMMSLTQKEMCILSYPFKHFRKFDIKFRNKESKEDAKSTLLDLEKDQLLLDLYYQLLLMKNWKENCKLSAFSLKKKNLSTSSGNLFLRRSDSLVNRKVLLNVTLQNSKD